jgi:hypothetical protein
MDSDNREFFILAMHLRDRASKHECQAKAKKEFADDFCVHVTYFPFVVLAFFDFSSLRTHFWLSTDVLQEIRRVVTRKNAEARVGAFAKALSTSACRLCHCCVESKKARIGLVKHWEIIAADRSPRTKAAPTREHNSAIDLRVSSRITWNSSGGAFSFLVSCHWRVPAVNAE